MNREESFNSYINAYKKLSLNKKRKIAVDEFKRTLAFLEKFKKDLSIKDTILLNREVLDVKEDCSEDDFVEAVLVYTHAIQESLGTYMDKICDVLYEEEEQL